MSAMIVTNGAVSVMVALSPPNLTEDTPSPSAIASIVMLSTAVSWCCTTSAPSKLITQSFPTLHSRAPYIIIGVTLLPSVSTKVITPAGDASGSIMGTSSRLVSAVLLNTILTVAAVIMDLPVKPSSDPALSVAVPVPKLMLVFSASVPAASKSEIAIATGTGGCDHRAA